ncbi:hypothetical protein [Salipaludibacillus daqingensis]|uniref:hypothetical protein n=1 Tax=Salipaludibacillus daqingensis TaxID=3041001 RepID=UPI0024758F9E|nr:hypothetical protein [Salipaludibacillus daqingensis]
MLKRFLLFLYTRVGLKIWVLSFLIFVLFLAFVLPGVAEQTKEVTGTSESPDGSYLYTAEDLYRIAGEYGEEGRTYYITSRFTFDVVWPLVYLFFLASSLTVVFKKWMSVKALTFVPLLPFAGVLFDFLENTSAAFVMWRYPLETPFIAQLAPVFTFFKWNFIYVSFICIVVGLAYRLFSITREKMKITK